MNINYRIFGDDDTRCSKTTEASFKVGHSWIHFDTNGRVWVSEWGFVVYSAMNVPDAIAWVRNFGDRD